MGDWPSVPSARNVQEAISPLSDVSVRGLLIASMGGSSMVASGTAWPAANRAIFVPFRLSHPWTVTQAVVGFGTGAGGNFDIGVYDQWGNRLVSSGATGRSASSEVTAALTDTVLGAGTYYMAMSTDGTANALAWAPAVSGLCKAMGVKEMASAYTLPSTATYATVSSAFVPSFAIWGTAL